MLDQKKFYINGEWVSPKKPNDLKVIDPSSEEECAVISLGDVEDVRTEIVDISPDLSIQVELPDTGVEQEFAGITTSDLSKFVRFDNRPELRDRELKVDIKKSPLDEQGGALAQIKESIEIKKFKSPDEIIIEELREEALDVIKIGTYSKPIESQVVKYPVEPLPLGIAIQDTREESQVATIVGPKGVVLEEIGPDGKFINDPTKDAGFDPLDPPDGVKALREEFSQYVESGQDEDSTFDTSLGFQSRPSNSSTVPYDGLSWLSPIWKVNVSVVGL